MKIVIVLTSHESLGETGRKTGFWLEGLAVPYQMLRDTGVDVTLASPKGGTPPRDPRSNEAAFQTDATRRFEADLVAMAALRSTRMLSSIQASDYAGMFVAEGHGLLWDLTNDRDALALIETMLATNKPVALVGHAPGILINVRTPDGLPIVERREVTGFTDAEEQELHLADIVPYSLERVLRRQGARFSAAGNWDVHVVRDGQVITAQNPASSKIAATTLLVALRTN